MSKLKPINRKVEESPGYILSKYLNLAGNIEGIVIGVVYKDGGAKVEVSCSEADACWLIQKLQANLNEEIIVADEEHASR